ncbi:MAG: type IV pilin biogenesis protein, partial [Nannocystaceae bacterium]|nr:type IV pilin biogenesis protein [Nannocystaceae bacterium]
RSDFTPPVAINDPHCGGRLIGASGSLPDSLNAYAEAVNDVDSRIASPSPHFEQQEAVVIADDMGVVHAFQLNSGNELFGFVPRFALESLVAQTEVGAATMGQDGEIEDHHYGVASTLNHGWVFDDRSADSDDWTWRHLGIIGMGVGGREWIALDLSHMSPSSPSGPIEVLWTSEDPGLKADYDEYNGETWARPAIVYHVDGDIASNEPDAFIVMGSGYPDTEGSPPAAQGRTLVRAEALTGVIVEAATLPAIVHDVYEDEFAALVDTAVATHCLSRFWAEAQEAYVADPAGRLFRWDLGRASAHESDSTGLWGSAAVAVTGTPFYACTGATTCSASSGNPGDPFVFPPAISANDRIDDFLSGSAGVLTETDQFLVALISGSAADDALTADTNFHSSVYVLVDDHSGPLKGEGFAIPSGTTIALPGTNPGFMRMPLSQIERERRFRPFPSSSVLSRTANFSPETRPIRAPRIFVTGVVDEDSVGDGLSPILLDGIEVYYIEFTVYEPPAAECDSDWHDPGTGQWYQDPGQTYTLTFRLTNTATTPFNLADGASDSTNVDFGGSFGGSGLVLDRVTQLGGTDCQDGDCGANPLPQGNAPCDNNSESPGSTTTAFSLSAYQSELQGFTPVE